jgi:hypothetical protein
VRDSHPQAVARLVQIHEDRARNRERRARGRLEPALQPRVVEVGMEHLEPCSIQTLSGEKRGQCGRGHVALRRVGEIDEGGAMLIEEKPSEAADSPGKTDGIVGELLSCR